MDHGVLNIPGRLKNLDREIDRQIAQQKKEARIQYKKDVAARKTSKAEAKRLFAEHGEAMIDYYFIKLNMPKSEAREILDQMVKWESPKFIKMVEGFCNKA